MVRKRLWFTSQKGQITSLVLNLRIGMINMQVSTHAAVLMWSSGAMVTFRTFVLFQCFCHVYPFSSLISRRQNWCSSSGKSGTACFSEECDAHQNRCPSKMRPLSVPWCRYVFKLNCDAQWFEWIWLLNLRNLRPCVEVVRLNRYFFISGPHSRGTSVGPAPAHWYWSAPLAHAVWGVSGGTLFDE